MMIILNFFAVMVSAICGIFAYMDLATNGTPLMGIVLFGCGAVFVGGWVVIAQELSS